MSTIKDVSKYTGLSISTISKYLNGGNILEENEIKVKEAINVLNYKVNEMARGLKTKKSMTVGVLMPTLESIVLTGIITQVENILNMKHYSMIICDYHNHTVLEKQRLEFLLNKMVDGLIIMTSSLTSEGLYNIRKRNIPVVLIDRAIDDVQLDMVLIDNENASFNAINELYRLGHRKVAILGGYDGVYTSRERMKGYHKACLQNNIVERPEYIKIGTMTIENGHNMMLDLLTLNEPPTAVFATNYEVTIGALIAINQRNVRLPDELSFIGFDSIHLSKVYKPELSMVMQPMQLIGEKAAELLLKRMSGDYNGFPEVTYLHSSLELKNSSASI